MPSTTASPRAEEVLRDLLRGVPAAGGRRSSGGGYRGGGPAGQVAGWVLAAEHQRAYDATAQQPVAAPVSAAARVRLALAEAGAALDELAACDRSVVDDDVVRATLTGLGRLGDRVAAQRTVWLGELDRRRAFTADGHRSARDWAAGQLRQDSRQAADDVRLARTLEAVPEAAAAFADGDISAEHAKAIARAVDTPDIGADPQAAAQLTADLLEVARHADPRTVRREARRRAIRDSGDRGAARAKRQFAARRAHLTEAHDGMWRLEALLTTDAAEYLAAALEPFCTPDATDVPDHLRRSIPQKRHDALVAMAKHSLDTDANVPQRGGRAAQALIIVDEASLADPSTVDPYLLAAARVAELASAGPVDDATARRIVCDSKARRVVLNAAGEVIDIGREARDPTVAQRLAVMARDGCCQGCGGPVAYVEIHHMIEWDDDGPTDVGNLVALCWGCHHGLHDAGWRLRRSSDGTLEFLDADGIVRRRRHPGRTAIEAHQRTR